MGSIPVAPFAGGATLAVVESHPPKATMIKAAAVATKANLRMRSSRSVPRRTPRMRFRTGVILSRSGRPGCDGHHKKDVLPGIGSIGLGVISVINAGSLPLRRGPPAAVDSSPKNRAPSHSADRRGFSRNWGGMLAPEVVQYAPIVRVGETAVQKDDRRTVADRRVIKADAVDLVESYTAARGPHATDHLAEVLGAAQLPWA